MLQRGVVYTATRRSAASLVGAPPGPAWAFADGALGTLRETLLPVPIAANSIPIIAFAPIANTGSAPRARCSRITIVALMTFFPTMINAVRGLTRSNRRRWS